MRISVAVKSGAKREYLREEPDGSFTVSVSAPAVEGAANKAVLRAIADHLKISMSRLMIVAGQRAKKKIIQID